MEEYEDILTKGLLGEEGALFFWMGPPNQPVVPYKLVELQEREELFDIYDFYIGPDLEKRDGHAYYDNMGRSKDIGIAKV